MKRLLLLICAVGMLCASNVYAATKLTLAARIHDIANEIKQALKENPLITGQKLAIGQFDGEGPKAANSNFGVEIQRRLGELLKDVRDDESEYTLAGNYVYTNGTGDNAGLKIIRIVVTIKQLGKVLVSIPDIEVNETDDIFRVLGLTGSTPHHQDQKQTSDQGLKLRNEAAQKAAEKPEFDLVDGHRVAAKGKPEWSVGILRKSTFNGPVSFVTPESVKGLAFTNVGVGEYYEVELTNNDRVDTIATVTVDGLDVANTFTSDVGLNGKKAEYPGFIVRNGTTVVLKGWLHTVDQSKPDNVFSFAVKELGHGAATSLKTRGTVGVVTVQFREACPPNGTLTRSFGETAKGEPLDQKFKLEPVQIGKNVLSTISIRYNRPE